MAHARSPTRYERRAEERAFDSAVTAALDELPQNFRRVVELVDVDGLTYQEAADVLGVPLGAVMRRLHRARRRITPICCVPGFGPSRCERPGRATRPTRDMVEAASGG